ncbi:RNA helicase [Platysternon megacephalum]|uniref:RNA helicase n=1 Tax=Platysternon megacephalum TaxID=55544 RepID=A0A4D9DCG9_9SAUR|nr:RNA helicase [Platysternon megacephalum]
MCWISSLTCFLYNSCPSRLCYPTKKHRAIYQHCDGPHPHPTGIRWDSANAPQDQPPACQDSRVQIKQGNVKRKMDIFPSDCSSKNYCQINTRKRVIAKCAVDLWHEHVLSNTESDQLLPSKAIGLYCIRIVSRP